MDFSTVRSVYCIGIKGVGMTALAQVLRGRGIAVSGSDRAQHFFTDDVLRRVGITVVEGFAAVNVPPAVDLVVRSTAYGDDHVEVAEARRRGLEVWTYPEAVADIFNSAAQGIAVCGSHGKTTTTAMLGYVLQEGGLDPTVIVGSEVPQFARQNSAGQSLGGFGGCARAGVGDLVVLEADEYQDKLAMYRPFGVVLTNVDYDHPDFFPTSESYTDAFRRFVARIPADGFLVACTDDPIVRNLAAAAPCAVIPYGLTVDVPRDLHVSLPGRHNVCNALGVLAAAARLGVPRDVALRAIASFQGTRRRLETVGDIAGVTVIDDYGHHPTEIRATIAAVRERYPGRRIICAFHAHTFTRTIALKDAFARAFVGCGQTYVMDIFGSAREQHGGITPEELAAAIAAHSPAEASGGVESTIDVLVRDTHAGDVVLCMGAGENDAVARGFVARLRDRV